MGMVRGHRAFSPSLPLSPPSGLRPHPTGKHSSPARMERDENSGSVASRIGKEILKEARKQFWGSDLRKVFLSVLSTFIKTTVL